MVLDLDETLVYADETPLERPADFLAYQYHVYERPRLREFITDLQPNFDLAVWSSASDAYVKTVVDRIFPDPTILQFVWGRSRATLGRSTMDGDHYFLDPYLHQNYLKPLSKVRRAGWSLSRVLIVDDTPAKCARNYGNAIYTMPYEGSLEDDELELLKRYLLTLKDEADVRSKEKRHWRDAMRRGAS